MWRRWDRAMTRDTGDWLNVWSCQQAYAGTARSARRRGNTPKEHLSCEQDENLDTRLASDTQRSATETSVGVETAGVLGNTCNRHGFWNGAQLGVRRAKLWHWCMLMACVLTLDSGPL